MRAFIGLALALVFVAFSTGEFIEADFSEDTDSFLRDGARALMAFFN